MTDGPVEKPTGAYVVAVYGERLDLDTGEFTAARLIEEHLKAVDSLSANRFDLILFVVNTDFPEAFESYQVKSQHSSPSGIPFRVIVRPNRGFSYGAWAAGLEHIAGTDATFAFLVEDDYLPASRGFAEPFLKKLSGSTGFVCQLFRPVPGVFPRHAAVSNGVISMQAVRDCLAYYGQIFTIFPFALTRSDHLFACENQVTFLALVESLEYTVIDIASEFSVPFFAINEGSVTELGVSEASAPLRPMQRHNYS